jgi:hypothetical protein
MKGRSGVIFGGVFLSGTEKASRADTIVVYVEGLFNCHLD